MFIVLTKYLNAAQGHRKHFGCTIWFQVWGRNHGCHNVIRTLCEKYREGNKPLDMVFVDLEKAYDTVPREVLWRCMRKHNIPAGHLRLVQDMYQGATTRVKYKRGWSEHFEVGIGLHQGSALSPFLFIMLVDTIYQDVRTELPWELLYADDLAIIDITSTDTPTQTAVMAEGLNRQCPEDQCSKD